ncbi:MAG TPA: ABC transporter permease [Rubrivivax sp.]
MPRIVPLWTDVVVWLLLAALLFYIWQIRRSPELHAKWLRVFQDTPAICSAVVLAAGLAVTVLDSLHFRLLLPATAAGATAAYDTRTQSVLDLLLARPIGMREASYSEPLAYLGFTPEAVQTGVEAKRTQPRLEFAGAHLTDPAAQWQADVVARAATGLLAGLSAAALSALVVAALLARTAASSTGTELRRIASGQTTLPWRAALLTLTLLCLSGGIMAALMQHYHVLGTDRTGNDVLVQCLKSIRTAFVIGSLSTIATLPLAVGLGIAAGYFRGWVDEVVQYLYTLLSSVPNVLLIAACVLMVQVFLDQNPELFETSAERADLKLFLLCAILGLTGWAGLCRLLRAETMKLRELEYVQAATAFGVSDWRIMARHIFPNVVHLMLITTVLDFCGLVLYEAVLSYVGVGVDPSMNSFGGMINLARSEMSRDPLVWWSFASAFTFMVGLVLAANLFADGVQTAFDPRSRVFKPRLALRPKQRQA